MDCNIYELIKGRTHYLAEESVRIYLYQLMKAVDHMHRHGIFHRLVRRRVLGRAGGFAGLARPCEGIPGDWECVRAPLAPSPLRGPWPGRARTRGSAQARLGRR